MIKSNSNPQFLFFAFGAHGKGLSGSDRIFIELARRWSKKKPISLYITDEGYAMCQRQDLDSENISFEISRLYFWHKFSFFIWYFINIIHACSIALRVSLQENTFCYSASEFWMDSLPGLILKLRYPNMTWIATWYQTAPNPFRGFKEGKRKHGYHFQALLYYLVQFPIRSLICNVANVVIVNNEDEIKRFPNLHKKNRVFVLLGAVDLTSISAFKKEIGHKKKIYDAVFQGRFHPQKGVVEIVEIWKLVCSTIPDAKLIMIGDGPLMNEVKEKINNLDLRKNIILTGYLFDGEEKYKIFTESKIVLHPSFYDSGGMAAAEAMAFGLPCIGFNLKAYQSYYPVGMVKVPIGDFENFSQEVISLLQDSKKLDSVGSAGEKMIYEKYSWDKRAEELYTKIVETR